MTIDHIDLYVENLEREKEFFEKYFGGKAGCKYHNQQTGFSSYFVYFENGAKLEIMSMPKSKQNENYYRMIGFAHIAFQMGSKKNVKELTDLLKSDGLWLSANLAQPAMGILKVALRTPKATV